jgi:hypothetical protein
VSGFLLDTNVLSEFSRSAIPPDPKVQHQVHDRAKAFVSMVIGERLSRPITNRPQVTNLPHPDGIFSRGL